MERRTIWLLALPEKNRKYILFLVNAKGSCRFDAATLIYRYFITSKMDVLSSLVIPYFITYKMMNSKMSLFPLSLSVIIVIFTSTHLIYLKVFFHDISCMMKCIPFKSIGQGEYNGSVRSFIQDKCSNKLSELAGGHRRLAGGNEKQTGIRYAWQGSGWWN